MLKDTIESDFEFSYQGENSIDINTLLASQFHFVASLSEIQKELYPDVDIKIKIAAFKEGSFVVQMFMETTFLQQMFTKDSLTVTNLILGSFASYIVIHKFLKGKKPQSVKEVGEHYEIYTEGNNSPVIIDKRVYNIYKHNTTLSQSVQKNFEVLGNDPAIEGIDIKKQGSDIPIIDIPYTDFEQLSKPNPYLDKEQNEDVFKSETVFIKKPNLFPEPKKAWVWSLLHKGRDIQAKIIDPEFEKLINDGLKVGQGDRLIVDLKIYYKWNEKFNTFIECNKFDIIKVHRLVPREPQSKMEI
jgi:hypothetical protein